MGLRPGSSLSSTCSAAGSSSPSTMRQEAETGATSAFCSALALLFWVRWGGELEGANNPCGRPTHEHVSRRTYATHACVFEIGGALCAESAGRRIGVQYSRPRGMPFANQQLNPLLGI